MKQILVIDDEALSRHMIRSSLIKNGFSVVTAPDGEEGLKTLGRTDVGLIISDIEMPHMDGHTLAKTLNGDPKYADIPLIFLTAQDRPDARLQGLHLGAQDYLTKPVNIKELSAKVANTLMTRERLLHQATSCLKLVLERLPMPAVLLDGDLRVHQGNTSMEELDAPITIHKGHLYCSNGQYQKALEAFVTQALQGHKPDPLIWQEDGALPFLIQARQPHQDSELILLTIAMPDWIPAPGYGIIFDVFNFTAREREMASLLLQGYPLPKVMEACEMARSTANTHLKSMFAKTATNRQTNLVVRLLMEAVQLN